MRNKALCSITGTTGVQVISREMVILGALTVYCNKDVLMPTGSILCYIFLAQVWLRKKYYASQV